MLGLPEAKETTTPRVDKYFVMIGAMVVFFILLYMNVSSAGMDYEKTLDQYEQWSIENPVEASRITSNTLSYEEVVEMITGKTLEPSISELTVKYIPEGDDRYRFCVIAGDDSFHTYRYSSKDQRTTVDENCVK